MESIKNMTELKQAIYQLEIENAENRSLLNKEFHLLAESINPISIIKGLFDCTVINDDLKAGVINNTLGIASGIAAKKILIGRTKNPFTNLFGFLIERAVAGKVTKNAGGILSIAGAVLSKLLHKKEIAEN